MFDLLLLKKLVENLPLCVYLSIYLYIYTSFYHDYLCKISLKANVVTDEGNGQTKK